MTTSILVGCDPEVFMSKDGKLVSAHGMVPGDKKNPLIVNKGAVQVDGMALEFNIDPAKNLTEFITNIETVMATLQGMVPEYRLLADPVAHFGFEMIEAQPMEAKELGCEPDFNAWDNGNINPRPDAKVPFRTGAGHIHIGWTKDMDIYNQGHREACIMLTKQFDYSLGIGSLLFDKDQERRTLYGKPGAFRYKPYGMEYRVLSNAWLKSLDLMEWVYNTTIKATQDLMDGRAYYKMQEFQPVDKLFSCKRVDKHYLKELLKETIGFLPKGV